MAVKGIAATTPAPTPTETAPVIADASAATDSGATPVLTYQLDTLIAPTVICTPFGNVVCPAGTQVATIGNRQYPFAGSDLDTIRNGVQKLV